MADPVVPCRREAGNGVGHTIVGSRAHGQDEHGIRRLDRVSLANHHVFDTAGLREGPGMAAIKRVVLSFVALLTPRFAASGATPALGRHARRRGMPGGVGRAVLGRQG